MNSLDEIIKLLCCGLGLVNPTYSCQGAPCKYLDLSPELLLSCSETGGLQEDRESNPDTSKIPLIHLVNCAGKDTEQLERLQINVTRVEKVKEIDVFGAEKTKRKGSSNLQT